MEIGLDPGVLPQFRNVMSQSELMCKKIEYQDILSVVYYFMNKLLHQLEGRPIVIVVTDEHGYILEMAGDEAIKQTIDQLGIKAGVQLTEEECGTNSVSIALREKMPIQLVGDQHYHHFLQQTACYSIPFHYSDNVDLLGSISIMTMVEHAHPFFLAMLSTAADSIERELLLRKQNRKLAVLNHIMMNTTRNGIVITDRDGNITEFNASADQLTGLNRDDLLEKPVVQLQPIGSYIDEVIRHGTKYEDLKIEIYNERENKKHICLFDAFPIFDEYSEQIGAFGQFRDITDRYEAEERYNYLAYHDDLTGLPNRRHFNEQLDRLIEEAGQHKHMLAVFYLDLDRFKLVNDTLGHSKGDYLLQVFAERLQKGVPEAHVVRMGGDEFSILLPGVKEADDAVQVAKKVMDILEQDFIIDNHKFRISTSIGISFYPHDGLDAETLMIHADMAMYQAKAIGKNQYKLYTPSMNRRSLEQLELENDLRLALKQNELQLFYQPLINIRTGKITGAEALLRWKHPKKGLVSPAEIVPLAEETGLIASLGEWVLEEACRHNKEWQNGGLPAIRVAVNLSSQQFHRGNCVETVERVLRNTGLDPKYLGIEITESVTMDVENTTSILRKLYELGVQISIDDFGIGYSSLNYLKKFSVHRLKIDRSFIKDLLTDEHNRQIVGTIISMAHQLGLEVVAEGVESVEQLVFLSEHHCDEAQGFLISIPLPAEAFAGRMRDTEYLFL
ncbi:EAL domain-containing protein [Paenibacillus sp. GYB003]